MSIEIPNVLSMRVFYSVSSALGKSTESPSNGLFDQHTPAAATLLRIPTTLKYPNEPI